MVPAKLVAPFVAVLVCLCLGAHAKSMKSCIIEVTSSSFNALEEVQDALADAIYSVTPVQDITSLHVVNATHVAVVPADVNNTAIGPALATACTTLDGGLAAALSASYADVSVSTALMGPAPDGKAGRSTFGCWKPLTRYNRNRQCCYSWAFWCSNCKPTGYTKWMCCCWP